MRKRNGRTAAAVLFGGGLQVRNQVVPVLVLFQSAKRHLCARNVLFGVLQVLEQGVFAPGDALALVCVGVGESLDLARLATKQPVPTSLSAPCTHTVRSTRSTQGRRGEWMHPSMTCASKDVRARSAIVPVHPPDGRSRGRLTGWVRLCFRRPLPRYGTADTSS